MRAVLGLLAPLLLLGGFVHAADPVPLPVVEVAPGHYVHQGRHGETAPGNEGDIANAGFIIGETAVAVVDSGGSARVGRRLLAALREITDLPVAYVINTHVHPDHIFGNAAFRETKATVIGHANLPRALAARGSYYLEGLRRSLGEAAGGSEIVFPDRTVADELKLELGGRTLLLTAWPTAHTDADLTVYDPASRTLWAGDLLFMERAPVIDGSLNGWLAAMEQLRSLPAERVIPGHGPASADWPEALDAQFAYLAGLREEIRAIIAAGGTIEQALATAGKSHREAWQLFEETNQRNIVAAFTELEWE